MIKKIIYANIAHDCSEDLAQSFEETFEHYEFGDLETPELIAIEEVLEQLKDAKILQKHAIAEFSEYHKVLKKEIKQREEDYF